MPNNPHKLTPHERRKRRQAKQQPELVHFVLGDVNSPESSLIDRELHKIFNKLNQTQSHSFSVYSPMLQHKVNSFIDEKRRANFTF